MANKIAIWSHLAVAGFSIALAFFIAAKYLAGDKYDYKIDHLKQKIKKNKSPVNADIDVDQKNEKPKKKKKRIRLNKRKGS